MKYSSGSVGRVFVVKFDDHDVLLDSLKALARKERLRCATFLFIGALRKGVMAAGPRKPVIPPSPNMRSFKDGWEVLGVGTLFPGKDGPQLHVHGSMGKARAVMTGCVRGASSVFLVVEAVVFELKGVKARKEIDPATGLNLLKIISGGE
jgi:uncharacterized protein